MSFFSFFKKSSAPAKRDDAEPQLPEQPQGKPEREIITIAYGTGLPIDVIYAFISRDFEQVGYEDALINPGVEYCKAKENIILNDLNQLFRRILLRYRDDMREIDVKIENAKQLFALTSASHLAARRETCEEHISEINAMIEKLKAKDPEMLNMIESYRRGFTKGCAAQNENFLKPISLND